MLKLIRSEFVRMFRYSSFWKCGIVAAIFDLICVFTNYLIESEISLNYNYDVILFSGYIIMIIVSSIITCSFIGTEFSCGTMRNKLISGKQHYQIYIADYIVCFSVTMLLNLVSIGIIGLFNIFDSTLQSSLTLIEILQNFLYSVPLFAFFIGLFVLIPMTVHKHSKSTVLSIVAAFAMLLAPFCFFIFSEISETAKIIVKYFPTTGLYSLTANETEHISRFIVTSIVSAVIVIAAGISIFRKKNVK